MAAQARPVDRCAGRATDNAVTPPSARPPSAARAWAP